MEIDLTQVLIRKANENEFEQVLEVERLAFGEEDEADLVANILQDTSAKPLVSLLAFYHEKAIGHLLYTKSTIKGFEKVSTYILAPLAVIPEFQKLGVGQKLMMEGDLILSEMGVEYIFVLGHPTYYPKNGFINDAEAFGFPAPYPIPSKDADAWMYKSLVEPKNRAVSGKVSCCNALDKEEYWRE